MFGLGVRTREAAPLESFSPMNPAMIDISRTTYQELTTDISELENTILPEYLDYYSTAMYWLRIIHLKHKNSHEMSLPEKDILRLTKDIPFCVPEPVYLQLKQTGNIFTPLKQHLQPCFPPLPTHVLNGFGGYYGPLLRPGPNTNDALHNYYEEIPCLGVMAAAVRASVSDQDPGPYLSDVTYRGLQPNANLMGFRPLGFRVDEAKDLARDCGITDLQFPSFPQNTSFNLKLLTSISQILSETSTFKNTEVKFDTLAETGAQSQLVTPHLTPILL